MADDGRRIRRLLKTTRGNSESPPGSVDGRDDYVTNRQVEQAPIGWFQGLSYPLAHNHIEIALAKQLMQRSASRSDSGDDFGSDEAASTAIYPAAAVDESTLAHIARVGGKLVVRSVAQTSLGFSRSY